MVTQYGSLFVVLCLIFVLFVFVPKILCSFEVTSERVILRFAGIPVRRLNIQEFESVDLVRGIPLLGVLNLRAFFAERLGISFSRDFIVIRKNAGFSRTIVL